MKTLGAFEAKTHLASLLDRVERGEEITITKHGRAVARLVPVNRTAPAEIGDVIERILATRKDRRLGSLSSRALIAEGRR